MNSTFSLFFQHFHYFFDIFIIFSTFSLLFRHFGLRHQIVESEKIESLEVKLNRLENSILTVAAHSWTLDWIDGNTYFYYNPEFDFHFNVFSHHEPNTTIVSSNVLRCSNFASVVVVNSEVVGLAPDKTVLNTMYLTYATSKEFGLKCFHSDHKFYSTNVFWT
jgi:hypothetical protein